MPTRKIKSSPVKVTGTAPDDQQFESSLEEDFFFLLRFNRLVRSFEANPVTIDWIDDQEKHRRYTPDVLVHYHSAPDGSPVPSVLCEVKIDLEPTGRLPRHWLPRKEDERENELKWRAAEIYAGRLGWAWKVVREFEIRTPYLKNAKFLLRHVERAMPEHRKDELVALLKDRGAMSLEHLGDAMCTDRAERAKILATCYGLIGNGQIDADLTTQLSLRTIVRLPT